MVNTPTLPHVSLPQIDVHDVADRVSDRAGDLGGLVSEVLATGYDKVHDLALVAVDRIDDLPDKAVALAGAVIPALRTSRRRSPNPWLILVAVLASFAVVAWVLKRRRASSEPVALPPASTTTPRSVPAAS